MFENLFLKYRKHVSVVAVVLLLATMVPLAAYADTVQNDVSAGGNNVIAAGGSTTINYSIHATGNDGCNAADGTAATVSISVPVSVTVSPTSLAFTGCGITKSAVFSSSSPGSYQITVSVSDSNPGDGYNINGAKWTLNVNAAPSNTAPQISVTGVVHGSSYQFGSVPAAGCSVVDTQDGPSSPAASLSAVTGPLASYGVGSRTASCTYTDAGGLTANASATYSIIDTTAPSLSLPGNQVVEAAGSSGAVANYSVSATDAVDSNPTVTCSPASGSTFPLGPTTVNCSATDSAGNSSNGSFSVTVQDTTGPSITVPSDISEEATSASGAAVSYSASGTDLVDGAVAVTCTPASGSTFALGSTPVNCSAQDAAGNPSNNSFNIIVQDTTAPVLALPADFSEEATGPSGAAVNYNASATDLVDGAVTPNCNPASGSTFPLGPTTVNCSATDTAGNSSNGSFSVTVQDTTGPSLNLPGSQAVEATGPNGAVVNYSASATDLVDGAVTPNCSPASGSTFPLGSTTVNCSATDAAGNQSNDSFDVTVQDTTAPSLSLPGNQTVEATGSNGAVVNYSASATDLVSGAVTPSCNPASGSTFPLGSTTVNCSAIDAAGNSSNGSFNVTVQDTTAPGNIQLVGSNVVDGATYYAHNLPTLPTGCTAQDAVTSNPSCVLSGIYSLGYGSHTIKATVTDAAGNPGSAEWSYSISKYTKAGFFSPVNMSSDVVNVVKRGSTVPLKFTVSGVNGNLTNKNVVDRIVVAAAPYDPTDTSLPLPPDATATGGTGLRYDATGNQFIYNWKTPSTVGNWVVTVFLKDGQSISASFRTK